MEPISPSLGWCEVPDDRNYNRPVKMPYRVSHERMLRDDRLYDACLVLDWNIRPRRRSRGSAIFFHLARAGFKPTAGCVAVTAQAMRRLLPGLSRHSVLRLRYPLILDYTPNQPMMAPIMMATPSQWPVSITVRSARSLMALVNSDGSRDKAGPDKERSDPFQSVTWPADGR
jgi:hypothetical protein